MLRRRDAFVALCLLDFSGMSARLDPSIEGIRRRLNLREAERHGADGRIRFRGTAKFSNRVNFGGQRASFSVVDDPEAN